MKLKGFGNRTYNIFFHLHTVSGIVLAVALFVIFFAGAFTLFKSEFYLWENPAARTVKLQETDLAEVVTRLQQSLTDFDLDDDTYITFARPENPVIGIYGHIKPEGAEEEVHYAGKMNPVTYAVSDKAESTVGETLYKLHYFAQIPFAGMWIAGFVSLFFIFATVTGVLVHWKNMLTKFWAFSFQGTWKQIWTNSHTVFGLLGLPYQFMYAVTGAFYLLLLLVLLPAVMVFYEGKPEKVYAMAYPMYGVEYNEQAPVFDHTANLASAYRKVSQQYGTDFDILAVQTHHVHKEDGVANFRLVSKDKSIFASNGYIGYRLKDGTELYNALPGKNKKWTYAIVEAVMQLHFASFGGLVVKGLYFVMALFSCFVFVSGILIWKEARDNNRYTASQKDFHRKVTKVFLAICFTLFPATALLFSTELLMPGGENHIFRVNTVFFVSWLLMALLAMVLPGSEKTITRFSLLTGGFFSLLVPLVNGLSTGHWFWKTPLTQVWATDVFWLVSGVLSFSVLQFMRPVPPREARVFSMDRTAMQITKKPRKRAKAVSGSAFGDSAGGSR